MVIVTIGKAGLAFISVSLLCPLEEGKWNMAGLLKEWQEMCVAKDRGKPYLQDVIQLNILTLFR